MIIILVSSKADSQRFFTVMKAFCKCNLLAVKCEKLQTMHHTHVTAAFIASFQAMGEWRIQLESVGE